MIDGTLTFDTSMDASNFEAALEEMRRYADGVSNGISGGFTILKGTLSSLLAGAITGITGSIGDLAKSVVQTGIDFESSMSEVQALSGATAEQMGKLTATAKEYGASTQYTAAESAQALKYMALAGWDAEQSISALPSVLSLAAASGMDLAQASDIVTDYISAFNLEAEDATRLADELAYAQANSNTSVEQLAEAYKNCAANLTANNQSMETTTSLLAMMANQGFKGAEAGTALTASMRDIASKMQLVDSALISANSGLQGQEGYIKNLSDVAGKYAITIGDTAVAVTDAEGNYRQMTDIVADLEQALTGLSDAQRSTALSATFTADSIKGINYLLNAGSQSAIDFANDLANSAGTAASAAETMQDNLQGSLTKMSSAFDGLKVSVFEEVKDPLRKIVDTITDEMSRPDVQKSVVGIAKTIGNALQKVSERIPEMLAFADKNLPKILNLIEKISGFLWSNKGLIAGIGAAFATQKVTAFAMSLAPAVTTIKNIPALVANIATPWGAVATAATLAAGCVVAYKAKVAEATREVKETVAEAAKLSKNMEAVGDKIDGIKDNYEDMQDSLSDTKVSIDVEYSNAQSLKDKLLSYLLPDGSIRDGYEKEVEDVISKINEIAGTSYTVSGGVVVDNDGIRKSYSDIAGEIDSVIQKQRAMAEYDALNADRASRQEDYNAAQQAVISTTAELQKLQIEQDSATEKMEKLFGRNQLALSAVSVGDVVGFSDFEEFAKEYKKQIDAIIESSGDLSDNHNLEQATAQIAELVRSTSGFQFADTSDLSEFNKILADYAGNLLQAGKNAEILKNANETLSENASYLQKMQEIDKAILDGDWEAVNSIFATIATTIKTTATAGTDELKEQYELYKRNAEAAKELYEQGTIDADGYNAAIKAAADATVEYARSGGQVAGEELWNAIANSSAGQEEKLSSFKDVLVNGFKPTPEQVETAMEEIGEQFTSSLATAIESSSNVQTAIDNTANAIDTNSFSASGNDAGNAFVDAFQSVLDGGVSLSSYIAEVQGRLNIGHNAQGTNNWRGGLTWINEEGGELVDLPNGTRIIPHDLSSRMVDQMAATAAAIQNNIVSSPTPLYLPAPQAEAGTGQQSVSATIPVSVYIGDEKIEETVVNAISRANAGSGGWSI